MHRNIKESEEHINLIVMMVEYLRKQGLRNIRADIPGILSPDIIFGTIRNHRPDLTADSNGKIIILEAETSNSISDDHTASQWSLFFHFSRESNGEFHLVVPKGERGSAERRAAMLGISIDIIWTPK